MSDLVEVVRHDLAAHDAAAPSGQALLDLAARASDLTLGAMMERSAGTRFVMVSKAPHLVDIRTAAVLVGRCLAFGVNVRQVVRLGGCRGSSIAHALYPAAHRGYRSLATAQLDAVAQRFDVDGFAAIFGRPFDPSMVLCGDEVRSRFDMSEGELTEIWESGRQPIGRTTLEDWYGAEAADHVLQSESAFDWFRGSPPFGIQRIGPGLVAFALRHGRLGSEPCVIVNGHFPGLSALFDEGPWVIDATLGHHTIASVRDGLIATVRADAASGRFPVDSDQPLDSRHNVVHCSDGLLTGELERAALLGRDDDGLLLRALVDRGLTSEETNRIVLRDPIIATGEERRLSDVTRGADLETCVDTILRFVPPVFGGTPSYGCAIDLASFERECDRLIAAGGDVFEFSRLSEARRAPSVTIETDLPEETSRRGIAAIARGEVGVLVPAGGTGGRFGGYGVPERHLRRQKAIAPVLSLDGRPQSSLSVRLANVAWWRKSADAWLPTAVMASDAGHEILHQWLAEHGHDDVDLFRQRGCYRLVAQVLEIGSRWIDAVVRNADGTPSLKPLGSLGVLTSFIMSGLHERWAAGGVEYLAIANADDVGFRVSPVAVGLLDQDPSVDAVLMVLPLGFRGRSAAGREVRGDVTGWCEDEAGRQGRVVEKAEGVWSIAWNGAESEQIVPEFDMGGSVCEAETAQGWRTVVVEGPATGGSLEHGWPFSTNQLYLRRSALDRIAGTLTEIDVQHLVARLPVYAERKPVVHRGSPVEAVQLFQGVCDILRLLGRAAPVMISRKVSVPAASTYATLKRPDDVPFANRRLVEMATHGDRLSFRDGA